MLYYLMSLYYLLILISFNLFPVITLNIMCVFHLAALLLLTYFKKTEEVNWLSL